jgi:hypothetical protein
MVSVEFLFVLLFSRTEQNPGGNATSLAKTARRRPDPTFDDYTQNSSEKPDQRVKNVISNSVRSKDKKPPGVYHDKTFCNLSII